MTGFEIMVHTVPPPYDGIVATCGQGLGVQRHTGWLAFTESSRELGYVPCPACYPTAGAVS